MALGSGPDVRFRTKQEYVYQSLRSAIMHGELPPGQRLVIDDIARRLEVSAIPIREALQSLQAEGLVVSVGAGETPLRNQATLSLWASAAHVQRFAYGGEGSHAPVVRRTNREGWYSEQLFARMEPLSARGTWDGVDPLALARAGHSP